MPAILEARDLVKKYGDFAAVNGISFDIQAGEIFSLLGPNGAGKTTTIAMLSTLFPPTSGTATVAGRSITREPMAVRAVIGVVPQELALYEDLTARENLSFWGQMYDLSGRPLKDRIAEVLEQIGLSDRADQRVKTYSGGMKRRVNIGVGLLHRPQLLFMDEPTVGIDPQSRRQILDSVKDLNRQGMTVLYTTHYMEEAAELSHRVGIIDHGELIALGTQAELTRQVGEMETLVLHLDGGEGDCAARLGQALGGIPTVIRADVGAGPPGEDGAAAGLQATLIAPEAEDVLAPAVSLVSDCGLKIRSIDLQEPDLEAVFLHLTGRALRD